jgi:GDP-L-fucose synthase
MTILITGAGGFLGKHVLGAIQGDQKQGYPQLGDDDVFYPSSALLDLTDPSSTMSYFAQVRPTVVLHMAAVCGGIRANQKRPADFIHLNTMMASNVFNAVYKYNVEYLYTLGSVCSYPKHCPVPFKEDDIWNGYPEETNAPYGTAKRLQLSMQQAYRQQYGLKGAHLIPVNMYGEYDHFDPENSHVIPALIRKFMNAIQNGQHVVECWGTGEATREFLYAGDCAAALIKAVRTRFDTPLPVNLGTGESISIRDLAYLIARLTGFHGDIVFTGEVSDGQPRRQLDVSRARDLLGFVAPTKLMKGLVRTICWYQDNVGKIKD